MSIKLAISTVRATPVTADWNAWNTKYGRYPDVAMYFQALGPPTPEPLMYSAAITDCVNFGMVPNVAWSTSTSVDLSTVPGGSLDSQLDSSATTIEASALTEVQCRLWHEFNAPGNPWGPNVAAHPSNPSDATFIAALQYAVTRMRQTTSKIKFVWCADLWTAAGASSGHNQDPTPRWPGSSYVDIIGWDGYSTTGYSPSFDNALAGTEANYSTIMGLSGASGIPFQISESGTGVQSQKKTWYHDAILGGGGLLAKYPNINQFAVFDRDTDGSYRVDVWNPGPSYPVPTLATNTGDVYDPIAHAAFESLIARRPFVDYAPGA